MLLDAGSDLRMTSTAFSAAVESCMGAFKRAAAMDRCGEEWIHLCETACVLAVWVLLTEMPVVPGMSQHKLQPTGKPALHTLLP